MPPSVRRHAYVPFDPSGIMVARNRAPMQVALSRVQPRATINADASAKHNQAYMYPGGIIKRAPSVMLNGRYYTDPRGDNHRTAADGLMQQQAQGKPEYPRGVAPGQPRRSIESNFLVTINPNRRWSDDGTDPTAARIFQRTLVKLCENDFFLACLKVPATTRATPDYSGHFKADALNWTDVITSVDAKGTVEIGEKLKRMHAHLIVEVRHFSMLQINGKVLSKLFKDVWNDHCDDDAYILRSKPYVDVQLLKQSNAMDIIKAYLHKSVGPVTTPDIDL